MTKISVYVGQSILLESLTVYSSLLFDAIKFPITAIREKNYENFRTYPLTNTMSTLERVCVRLRPAAQLIR